MKTCGKYAVYKGKEYKAFSKKQKIMLISEEKDSLKYGFKLNVFKNYYELEVSRDELDKYYSKQLYCTYKGHVLDIVYEDDKHYCLNGNSFSDDTTCKELGFKMVGRFEWEKLVDKSDVEQVWWEEEEL